MTKPKNRAKCSNCGDVLISTHVHDWVACSCFMENNLNEQKNGINNQGIFIDGGDEYWRCGGNLGNLMRYINRTWTFAFPEEKAKKVNPLAFEKNRGIIQKIRNWFKRG